MFHSDCLHEFSQTARIVVKPSQHVACTHHVIKEINPIHVSMHQRNQKMMIYIRMTKNRNLEPHKKKRTRVDKKMPQLLRFVWRVTNTVFSLDGLVRKLVGILGWDVKPRTDDQRRNLDFRILSRHEKPKQSVK